MADVKKWIDDAKAKAAQEAGKAVVDGAVSAIEGRLDGWLGSMEAELARRTQEAPPAPLSADAPPATEVAKAKPAVDVTDAPSPGLEAKPTAEDREVAARVELERLKSGVARIAPPKEPVPVPPLVEPEVQEEVEDVSPGARVVAAPLPPRRDPMDGAARALEAAARARGVEPVPLPPPPPPKGQRDPFAAAEAALAKAREARRASGLPEPEEPPRRVAPVAGERRDPFAAAQEALAKAAEARAGLGRSAVQLAREERAKDELARLKQGRGGDTPSEEDEAPAPPPGPRRRTL